MSFRRETSDCRRPVDSRERWSTFFSFKQNNDPQTVSLPLPATSPKFWRVIAQ
jgi:hypothetical protein